MCSDWMDARLNKRWRNQRCKQHIDAGRRHPHAQNGTDQRRDQKQKDHVGADEIDKKQRERESQSCYVENADDKSCRGDDED